MVAASTKKHAQAIDRAMDRSRTREAITAKRGTGLGAFGGKPPVVGQVYTEYGYLSTSLGTEAAFSGTAKITFSVPPGTPAYYVDEFSAHQGERELLIGRNASYVVTSAVQHGYNWYVEATLLERGEYP